MRDRHVIPTSSPSCVRETEDFVCLFVDSSSPLSIPRASVFTDAYGLLIPRIPPFSVSSPFLALLDPRDIWRTSRSAVSVVSVVKVVVGGGNVVGVVAVIVTRRDVFGSLSPTTSPPFLVPRSAPALPTTLKIEQLTAMISLGRHFPSLFPLRPELPCLRCLPSLPRSFPREAPLLSGPVIPLLLLRSSLRFRTRMFHFWCGKL